MSGPRGVALVVVVVVVVGMRRRRRSDSSFPNPVRLVVSSIPQTSSICERRARRDSYRRKRGPSARGVLRDLSGATFAIREKKSESREGAIRYARTRTLRMMSDESFGSFMNVFAKCNRYIPQSQ